MAGGTGQTIGATVKAGRNVGGAVGGLEFAGVIHSGRRISPPATARPRWSGWKWVTNWRVRRRSGRGSGPTRALDRPDGDSRCRWSVPAVAVVEQPQVDVVEREGQGMHPEILRHAGADSGKSERVIDPMGRPAT